MSDIIYTPPASSGGGQNPTANYIPLNDGTSSFVDSNIYNLYDTSLITGSTAVGYFGYNIDFTAYNVLLGDFNYNQNNTFIIVDDANQYFQTNNQGNDVGLFLDFAGRVYCFGDFSGYNNGTSLCINESADIIYTANTNGNQGILLNLNAKDYRFGDFSPVGNGTVISIKDSAKVINLECGGGAISLYTNGGNLNLGANQLFLTGTLTSGSASGSSGQHLQVTINGTAYKIALLNP